jgi:predicted house-cleaning noncanonical NTP pyrophosphatase (MazG superfamily)
MEKIYDKLVRDKIPQIINNSGKTCHYEILDDEKYIALLDAKLFEEMLEYHQDKNLEELADIVEVIYAIAKSKGCSVDEFDKIRKDKADERGGFDKKILLKSVVYEED